MSGRSDPHYPPYREHPPAAVKFAICVGALFVGAWLGGCGSGGLWLGIALFVAVSLLHIGSYDGRPR